MTPTPRRMRRLRALHADPRPVARARTLLLALSVLLALAGCGRAPETAAPADADPSLASVRVVDRAPTSGEHAGHEPLTADAPLPGASLYHLDAVWTDHRGETLQLAELRGRPVIVTMIYASCETACPILVRDAGRVFDALPEGVRDRTRVLVVSFDPARDAPERLAAYVDASGLEHPSWRFAVGEPHATRALAALLGVRYRALENGMFSHTNLITVLGPDGAVRQRSEGLGLPVEPAVEAVTAALSGAAR